MNTLTSSPLAPVLERLFAEAEQTEKVFRQDMANLSPADRAARSGRAEDYKTFYMTHAKNVHLAVSRETATFLYMLGRSCKARSIVEFGTSFAVSTLHLAAAIKDNGGGRVIGTEFEPANLTFATGSASGPFSQPACG